MTAVRELLSRHPGLELAFIQQRDSGTVHVVLPDDPDAESGPEFRFDEIPEDALWSMALGETPTLCGYLALQHVGGAGCGDQLVGTFDDTQLCGRCWRALGTEHQPRAFEHPTRTPPINNDIVDVADLAGSR